MAEKDTTKTVIIPLLRKVYPGVIANQILGVQPMTGTGGFSVFKLRTNTWRFFIRNWWVRFFWRGVPGTTINVPWPHSGSIEDYVAWLTQNVGTRYRDWAWRFDQDNDDRILIKFRWGKGRWATTAALMWS